MTESQQESKQSSKFFYNLLPKKWSRSTKKGVIQILQAFGIALFIFIFLLHIELLFKKADKSLKKQIEQTEGNTTEVTSVSQPESRLESKVQQSRSKEENQDKEKKCEDEYIVSYFCWLGESKLLGQVQNFAVLVAAILYGFDVLERRKQMERQAWQLIDGARGSETSGGRYQAILDLYEEDKDCLLRGLDANRADLREIELPGANLERANFRSADLQGANLEGAILYDANLIKADLRGANLSNAKLMGADLREAKFNNRDHNPDKSEDHLQENKYFKERSANLQGADLRWAKLDKANFDNANLSQAKLNNVIGHATFHKANLSNIQPVDFLKNNQLELGGTQSNDSPSNPLEIIGIIIQQIRNILNSEVSVFL
ncbi:hypothetical protein F7734_50845 [Scytonema sp. UIC 10036]|uniref:pentapeptide repeat-containing protein n=1 Tax=Scytonema sp. UIC 10036 TaxID=2304196 RepID=UPI0012DA5D11|nr:pentapeptide repeat-containing protein [Scytonema sp. UIC 10036]MUH00136.1 hypothetical protein [Scytonema sp. UIC 10036]